MQASTGEGGVGHCLDAMVVALCVDAGVLAFGIDDGVRVRAAERHRAT